MAYTRQQFIEMIAPYAVAEQGRTGIPASVTIAQSILESADKEGNVANSELTRLANALFGVKGTGPAGSVNMRTREEGPNGSYYINADFKKYNSWEESIQDHSTTLLKPRYAKLIGADGYTAAQVLQDAGYATDKSYAADLQSLMKTHNLLQYDKAKPNGVELVSALPKPDSGGGFFDNLNPLAPIQNFDWLRVMWALVGILILAAGLFIAFGASNPVMQMVQGVSKNVKSAGKAAQKAAG